MSIVSVFPIFVLFCNAVAHPHFYNSDVTERKVSCMVPSDIGDGRLVNSQGYSVNPGSRVEIGEKITLICRDGPTIAGTNEGVCSALQTFVPPLGRCASAATNPPTFAAMLPAVCKVPYVPHGSFYWNNKVVDEGVVFRQGNIINLICSAGYQPEFESQAMCRSNGKWSSNRLICIQAVTVRPEVYPTRKSVLNTCPMDLPGVTNGYIASGDIKVGSERSVYCNPGYKIVGTNFITCQPGGRWSEPGMCNISVTTTQKMREEEKNKSWFIDRHEISTELWFIALAVITGITLVIVFSISVYHCTACAAAASASA